MLFKMFKINFGSLRVSFILRLLIKFWNDAQDDYSSDRHYSTTWVLNFKCLQNRKFKVQNDEIFMNQKDTFRSAHR